MNKNKLGEEEKSLYALGVQNEKQTVNHGSLINVIRLKFLAIFTCV